MMLTGGILHGFANGRANNSQTVGTFVTPVNYEGRSHLAKFRPSPASDDWTRLLPNTALLSVLWEISVQLPTATPSPVKAIFLLDGLALTGCPNLA